MVADRISVLVAGVLTCAIAHAANPVGADSVVAPDRRANPYAERSDVQLTELAAQWETLDDDQRRALLTEVKHRMAVNKAKDPIITIKTRRRYGRTYRGPDGALVRIETTEEVLRYHRPATMPTDGQAFGTGFERRAADRGPPPQVTEPPASGTDDSIGRTNVPVFTVSDPR